MKQDGNSEISLVKSFYFYLASSDENLHCLQLDCRYLCICAKLERTKIYKIYIYVYITLKKT